MRTIRAALALLVISLFATIDASPSAAQIYHPWCAEYTGRGSATNCGFSSFEQCMMTARGDGSCVQNPWYLWYGERGPSTSGQGGRARNR